MTNIQGTADLSKCSTIVMDEADKLLSPEFEPILEKLIGLSSPTPQIMLFSATFPVAVKAFKDKHIPNPYEINLMEELTLKGVTQYYAFVEEKQKVCICMWCGVIIILPMYVCMYVCMYVPSRHCHSIHSLACQLSWFRRY
jgi:superfamily II DNA/RNA helicase